MKSDMIEYAVWYGLVAPLDLASLVVPLVSLEPFASNEGSLWSRLFQPATAWSPPSKLDTWSISKDKAATVATIVKALARKSLSGVVDVDDETPPARSSADEVVTTRFALLKTPRPLDEKWTQKRSCVGDDGIAASILSDGGCDIDESTFLAAEAALPFIDELLDVRMSLKADQARAIGAACRQLVRPGVEDHVAQSDLDMDPEDSPKNSIRSPPLLPLDHVADLDLGAASEELFVDAPPTDGIAPCDTPLQMRDLDRWDNRPPLPSSSPLTAHSAVSRGFSLPSSSPPKSDSPYKPDIPLLPRDPSTDGAIGDLSAGLLHHTADQEEAKSVPEGRRQLCRDLGLPSSPGLYKLPKFNDQLSPCADACHFTVPSMPPTSTEMHVLTRDLDTTAVSALGPEPIIKASGAKALSIALAWRPSFLQLPPLDSTDDLDATSPTDEAEPPILRRSASLVSVSSQPGDCAFLPRSPSLTLAPRSSSPLAADSDSLDPRLLMHVDVPTSSPSQNMLRDTDNAVDMLIESPASTMPPPAVHPDFDAGEFSVGEGPPLSLAARLQRHLAMRGRPHADLRQTFARLDEETPPAAEGTSPPPLSSPQSLMSAENVPSTVSYAGPAIRCVASFRLLQHPMLSALRAANFEPVESPIEPNDGSIHELQVEPDLMLDASAATSYMLLVKIRGVPLARTLHDFATQGYTRQLLVLIGPETTAATPPVQREMSALRAEIEQLGLHIEVEHAANSEAAATTTREWAEKIRTEAIERAEANGWWSLWMDDDRDWLFADINEDMHTLMSAGIPFIAASAILSRVDLAVLVSSGYEDRFKSLAGILGRHRATSLCAMIENNKRYIEAAGSDQMAVDELT